MARMKAEEAGSRAFDILVTHPGGLSRRMWKLHSDLTEAQLARGIDYLRDLFDDGLFVRVLRGGEWIYQPDPDSRDLREDAERQLRSQITRVGREFRWWHKAAQRDPSVENERQEELARRRLLDLRYAYDLMFSGGGQESIAL